MLLKIDCDGHRSGIKPNDSTALLAIAGHGQPLGDLLVTGANREHGIVAQRPGTSAGLLPPLPVGTRLRILPNHAYATAAQHSGYQVLATSTSPEVTAFWPRFGGW